MALILCPDCNREISDRAPACPQCGAPNAALTLAPPAPPPPAPAYYPPTPVYQPPYQPPPTVGTLSGSTCPFCGHIVMKGATVCHCGAYYGYKDTRLADRRSTAGVLLLVGMVICVVGMFAGAGAIMAIGGLVALFFLLSFLLNSLRMLGGKQWWRRF